VVILGLDPGIAETGYAVVEARGQSLRALVCGVVRTRPSDAAAARLARIHAGVAELIAAHEPTAAAVEELYVGPNPRAILAVGQARGAALSACGAAGLEVCEYAVSTIKTAVCGYGRAEKGQVARMVRAILALPADPRNEHEADALAAAVCHANQARFPAARRPA
jgi:crossover junction endodeoxyribonuclease RuvC